MKPQLKIVKGSSMGTLLLGRDIIARKARKLMKLVPGGKK